MSDKLQPKTCGLFDGPRSTTVAPAIERRGDKVVRFPFLAHIQVPLTDTDFDTVLSGCELLILTDVIAASEFVARLDEFNIDPQMLDNLTVCALGEAVADCLRFVQIHADIIPPRTTAETVAESIANYIGDLSNSRIVCAGEAGQHDRLTALLQDSGADVKRLDLYKFAEMPAGVSRLTALLAGGGLDEFVFCEPRDVLMLEHIADRNSIANLFLETAVLAASEVEFCSLQEAGLRPLYFRR